LPISKLLEFWPIARLNVNIKRTRSNFRNEKNSPSSEEKQVLVKWNDKMINGESLSPQVIKHTNGEILFMAPIKLKTLCLTCHGTKEAISIDVNASIIKHYPHDAANNYNEGDSRGAWSITFPKGYFDQK